jgi:rhomboid family GlyGly-CTERM serine protease
MGLDKLRNERGLAFLRPASAWLVPLGISLSSLVIALGGDAGREVLRYQREAIADGEFWRLFFGHLAHLGISHLLLNIAGLLLIWFLVGHRFRNIQWIAIVLICVAGIDLGFWFLDKQLNWYVGLSGLLHGLLLAGAIAGISAAKTESLTILVVVLAKLAWEQIFGPLPGSEASSGGNVIVNAHLYGAIAGVIAALVLRRSAKTGTAI